MTRDEEVMYGEGIESMEKWGAYLVALALCRSATEANRKELELATHKAWIAYYKAKFPTQEWR